MATTFEWKGQKAREILRARVRRGVLQSAHLMRRMVIADLKRTDSLNVLRTPAPPGGPPATFLGTLGLHINVDPSGIGDSSRPHVRVGTDIVYGRIQELGGAIFPKRARNVVVPLCVEAKRKAAESGSITSIPDLVFVPFGKGKRGGILYKHRTAWTTKKAGRKGYRVRGSMFGKTFSELYEPWFLLTPGPIVLPPRPYLRPARDRLVQSGEMVRVMRESIRNAGAVTGTELQ